MTLFQTQVTSYLQDKQKRLLSPAMLLLWPFSQPISRPSSSTQSSASLQLPDFLLEHSAERSQHHNNQKDKTQVNTTGSLE